MYIVAILNMYMKKKLQVLIWLTYNDQFAKIDDNQIALVNTAIEYK